MLEGERSRQKEENTGGQTPRGYPGQALSVGPAESSGLCLVIDISNQIELSKSDEACLFKNAHIRALRRFGISRVRFCVLVGCQSVGSNQPSIVSSVLQTPLRPAATLLVNVFKARTAKSLFQIAHLFEGLWCDTICGHGETSSEDPDEAARKIRWCHVHYSG